jgi:hypothetical protein
MAKRRTILIVPGSGGGGGGGSSSPAASSLGSLKSVLLDFAPFNTAPDGSGNEGMGDALGVGVLHGPGFRAEVPTMSEVVAQVIITISDEDFAFPVLMKMCRLNKWKMMDPESGQSYG